MTRPAVPEGRVDRLVGAALGSPRVLRALVVLSVVLTVGAVAMGLATGREPVHRCPPTGEPTVLDRTPLPASAPVSMVLDGIDACSSLVPVGVDAARRIEVPPVSAPEQAAWYRLGPTPGQRGPAVLLGHVNGDGREGVFADLADVERGDRVAVGRADGRTAVFVVTGRIQVAKDAFPTASVYGRTAGPELRLITCGGALDRTRHEYADNVVVFADYVGWR